MEKQDLTLYEWLKENNISIAEFSEKTGCHRNILRWANNGRVISREKATIISIFTQGKIKPKNVERGRPKKVINNSTEYPKP